MGFFKDFAKGFISGAFPKKNVIEHESTSRTKGAMRLELGGSRENKVYTYYKAPLKGTRKGDTFYADVVTKRVVLESELTGMEWDTATDEGYALARDGAVFGTGRDFEDIFRALDADGHTVRVLVRRDGIYQGKIPLLTMLTPNSKQMREWFDACQRAGEIVEFE